MGIPRRVVVVDDRARHHPRVRDFSRVPMSLARASARDVARPRAMKRSGRATATSKTRAMNASTSETVSPLDRALEELRARAETLVPEEAKKAAMRTAYASSAGLRFAF